MDLLLNEDMIAAIDNANLSPADKEMIRAILSRERQNKERNWDKDAEKYIMGLISKNQATSIQ